MARRPLLWQTDTSVGYVMYLSTIVQMFTGLSSAGARCVLGATAASQRQRLSPLTSMCMQGQCCSNCALECSIQEREGCDCMSEKHVFFKPISFSSGVHHFSPFPHHLLLSVVLCAFVYAETPQFCFCVGGFACCGLHYALFLPPVPFAAPLQQRLSQRVLSLLTSCSTVHTCNWFGLFAMLPSAYQHTLDGSAGRMLGATLCCEAVWQLCQEDRCNRNLTAYD
jgi:hypothetical protein